MTTFNDQDMEIVRKAAIFDGLPGEALDKLIRDAHVVTYQRGKLLFLRGEPAKRFYLLLDGWVKVFRDTPEGEQTVIAILRSGETVAEAAIFLGKDFPASAEVVSDVRMLEMPAEPFLSLLREDGDLGIKMLGALSMRLRGLILHIEQIQARSTPQRLVSFLLELVNGKEGPEVIHLPYDKSLIAARLGMKPESLSRALAKLRDIGVTTKGHEIFLRDIGELKEFSEGSDED